MPDSLRYKIVLWLVWVQIALIVMAFFMIDHTDPDRVWRWNVPFWTLLIGYVLGFLLLPFSRELEKSKTLKWWLRIDLAITILMLVPAYFGLAGCHVRYISEKGDYILLNRNGFLSAPFVQLGVKSGVLIKSLNYFPVEYWNISHDDWDIDDTTGCFWLTSSRNNDRQLFVVPLDSCKYKINETVINKRIDSLYHCSLSRYDRMDFVMPDDFSTISYTDSASVSYFNTDDCWYPFAEIIYTPEGSNISPDSVIIRCKDSKEDVVYPKDYIPHMSPTQIQQFIRQLKGGKQ